MNIVEENKLQKDEFNYTKFNTVTNTTDVYDALKYKYAPFKKKKSVVHKSELENCQFIDKQKISSA